MNQAVARCITIVAGLYPLNLAARARDVATLDFDWFNAFAKFAMKQNRGGIRIVEHQCRMRGGRSEALFYPGGDLPTGQRGAAAIDDEAVRAVRHFERQGRSAAPACMSAARRRGSIHLHHSLATGKPMVSPMPHITERASAYTACIDKSGKPVGTGRAIALPTA